MVLRAAAVQHRPCGDRAATLRRAASLIDRAAAAGSRLIVLPECFTGIYGVPYFRDHAEDLLAPGSGSNLLSSKAAEHGAFVSGGIIERSAEDPDRLYNTIAAYGPDGQEVARYRKLHLSRVKVGPDQTAEGSVLTKGTDLGVFDIDDHWRVGLACCFDLRFRDVAESLCDRGLGANILAYPSAFLQSTGGKLRHWRTLLEARALDHQVFVMGPNQSRQRPQSSGTAGEDGTAATTEFCGQTMIVGPLGETLGVCANDYEDGTVVATLELDHLADVRQRIPLSTDLVAPEDLAESVRRLSC